MLFSFIASLSPLTQLFLYIVFVLFCIPLYFIVFYYSWRILYRYLVSWIQNYHNSSQLSRLIHWTVLCSVGAIPSFIWSFAGDFSLWGKLVGIVIFVCGYMLISPYAMAYYNTDPIKRSSFAAMACVRLLICTIMYPVGFYLDFYMFLFTNIFMLMPGSGPFYSPFELTLIITLWQGLWLNVMMYGYGIIDFWLRTLLSKQSRN